MMSLDEKQLSLLKARKPLFPSNCVGKIVVSIVTVGKHRPSQRTTERDSERARDREREHERKRKCMSCYVAQNERWCFHFYIAPIKFFTKYTNTNNQRNFGGVWNCVRLHVCVCVGSLYIWRRAKQQRTLAYNAVQWKHQGQYRI